MHTETRRRILDAAGFEHVAGWVQKKSVPAMQAVIDETKPLIEQTLRNIAHKHDGDTE
jgi:hypothetical protein